MTDPTPEQIEAGVGAYYDWTPDQEPRSIPEVVTAIFKAMTAAGPRVDEIVREAYREGWMVNATPPEEHEAGADYVRGCEEVDWRESKARAAIAAIRGES